MHGELLLQQLVPTSYFQVMEVEIVEGTGNAKNVITTRYKRSPDVMSCKSQILFL